ncbi:MAG: phosphoglycerate kinase, partial [bacterium]|nr:phosphoglycerate kinase [bacterium]
ISKDDTIIDVGTETIKLLASVVKKSKLILWNGPLGKYEVGGDRATKSILKEIAKIKNKTTNKTTSIIGGGDTVELIDELKLSQKFTFVSTGGGATLNFLSAGTLPGIKALK